MLIRSSDGLSCAVMGEGSVLTVSCWNENEYALEFFGDGLALGRFHTPDNAERELANIERAYLNGAHAYIMGDEEMSDDGVFYLVEGTCE